MVFDALEQWQSYDWPTRFTKAFEFLLSLDNSIDDGKHLLEGDDLFCNIETYQTTPRVGHEFETHRQYADIQMLLSGEEVILWTPAVGLTVTKPYEPDIEFQELIPEAMELVLKPSLFCVFLPQDAHAPCIAHGGPATVRKAVMKVRIA